MCVCVHVCGTTPIPFTRNRSRSIFLCSLVYTLGVLPHPELLVDLLSHCFEGFIRHSLFLLTFIFMLMIIFWFPLFHCVQSLT